MSISRRVDERPSTFTAEFLTPDGLMKKQEAFKRELRYLIMKKRKLGKSGLQVFEARGLEQKAKSENAETLMFGSGPPRRAG